MNNIIPLNKISKIKQEWENKKVILVGGCFDLLHYGHLTFLEKAKEQGDILVIALESDEFILKHKKRQPVHTQEQRSHILATIKFVDCVVLLPTMKSNEDYAQLVQEIHPAVIATTEGDPHLHLKERHAQKYGAVVKTVAPLLSSFSSSSIITYATILSD